MTTINLFVIANVKQLRTGGSFRILLPFFRTSCGVGVLNSAIFNSFHNRVEFGTILGGVRNFGGGGFEHPNPPLGTPLATKEFDIPSSLAMTFVCSSASKLNNNIEDNFGVAILFILCAHSLEADIRKKLTDFVIRN